MLNIEFITRRLKHMLPFIKREVYATKRCCRNNQKKNYYYQMELEFRNFNFRWIDASLMKKVSNDRINR